VDETLHATAAPTGAKPPPRRVLIVEPDDARRAALRRAAAGSGSRVTTCADFVSARASLRDGAFDFLVTNLRLGAFNGLHLVYLAASACASSRSIVYDDADDRCLAREVQNAGAFYEVRQYLPLTLTSYLRGPLPQHDRRDPNAADPGAFLAGGRRRRDRLAGAARL
jgi:DNA-binding NtrC family response regulator